jgi:hypothetical protein
MTDNEIPSPPPKRLWLSYAWADNKSDDVDFIAQQLEANGLKSIWTGGTSSAASASGTKSAGR